MGMSGQPQPFFLHNRVLILKYKENTQFITIYRYVNNIWKFRKKEYDHNYTVSYQQSKQDMYVTGKYLVTRSRCFILIRRCRCGSKELPWSLQFQLVEITNMLVSTSCDSRVTQLNFITLRNLGWSGCSAHINISITVLICTPV